MARIRFIRVDSSVPLMLRAASAQINTIAPMTSPGPSPSGSQKTAR